MEAWAYPTGGQGRTAGRDEPRLRNRQRAGYVLYAASDNTWQFWLGTGTNEWDIVPGRRSP